MCLINYLCPYLCFIFSQRRQVIEVCNPAFDSANESVTVKGFQKPSTDQSHDTTKGEGRPLLANGPRVINNPGYDL